ncbi:MAG: hypothetical protein ACR2QW_04415 [bacterium]
MSDSGNNREQLKHRIRDNHTSVYLTIVSIIVALALGDLFTQVREIYKVGGTGVSSVLLWLQIIGAFSAAFNVWVGYCHIFITVAWILGIWDALSVMLLLIVLYLINTTVGAENSAWWLGAMSIIFLAGGCILYVNLQRAKAGEGAINDALPEPKSMPFVFMIVAGGLMLFFSFLVFAEIVSDFTELVFAATTTVAAAYWPFLWVKTWRKSVGIF